MSYQQGEDQPYEQLSERSYSVWKVFGVLLVVSALALLGVSSSYARNSTTISSKVQLATTSKMSYSDLSETEKQSLFTEFTSKFHRQYASDAVKAQKYANFKEFLKLIDERNAKEKGSAVHGITRFADVSHDEFKQKYLGYKTKPSKGVSSTVYVSAKYNGSANSVDWTGTYTTAVKDQGYCGSCWAFSATEQIESDAIRAGFLSTVDELSPQQIVSCDHINWGCDGGNTETAYQYVMNAAKLVSEVEYPYTSYWDITGSCLLSQLESIGKTATINGYYSLVIGDTSDTEYNMANFVLSTGPISVCLDAEEWSTYTSGVVSSCGYDVDHCVQVVGLNLDGNYWIVRNSWSAEWGLDGYIYLEYGSNTCFITYDPTFTSSIASN